MTEIDLPRGGSIVEKKEKRPNQESEEDGLFQKKAKKEGGKSGKREQLPEGHTSTGKENAFDGVWKDAITAEVMVAGVLGLGYVSEIRTSDIVLETAASFKVVLPLLEIGAHGLAEMKAERLQVEDAFPIGHAVPFMVQKKPAASKTKAQNKPAASESSAVKVTSDPAKLNKHLGPTTIAVGLALAAEVKSVEEKGLILDLGLKSTNAFLASDLLPANFSAKIGMPLVVRIQSTSNMRMLQVALAVEMDTLCESAVSSLSLRSIMPGTILLATPLQTKGEGAYVTLGNGVNAWLPRRAMPPRIRANIESFVRPLRVVVLLCQQNSRLLCISAHPDIVAVSRAEKRRNYEGVHLGDVVKCEVTRWSKTKVEMKMVKENEEEEGADRGSLVTVVATQGQMEGGGNEKKYAVGSRHEMRVMGLKVVERTISVGNTKEIMKQAMVSYHDAKSGAKVSAVIKKLSKSGIHVLVFGTIRGFIPLTYMADKPLESVEKAFPINDSIPCRVLSSSEEHRNVLLTARKSQVTDTGSLITSFEGTQPGQTCVGVLVHHFPKGGLLVAFYDDVKGYLPEAEIKKKKNLQLGDAVQVRVVSVEPEKGRMLLALADGTMPTDVVVRAKTATIVSPSPLTGTVKSVNGKKKGLEGVEVEVKSQSVTITPALLSDSLDSPFSTGPIEEMLPQKNVEGQEMSVASLGDQSGLKRGTTKRFLCAWASKVAGMTTRIEELELGMVLPGVVSQRVTNTGYTIELPGGSGLLARLPFSAINEGTAGEQALSIGATVLVKISELNVEKKKIEVEMDWSSPSSASSFSIPMELLRSAIEEQQWLAGVHGLPKMGERITGTVVQVLEDVCLIKVEGEKKLSAYARKGNFEKEQIKKDATVSALVIDYAWPRGDVEVVIVDEEKKTEKKKGGKKSSSSSSTTGSRVVLSKRDYVGVIEGGAIVYCNGREHVNHVIRSEDLPAVGSTVSLTAETATVEGVSLRGREGAEERKEKARKEMEGRGKEEARVKKVLVAALAEEEKEVGGAAVKKFGIYKARVESLVEQREEKRQAGERARCAIMMKMQGTIGRLHVSELPSRFLVEGTKPLETFLKEYQHRTVHALTMTLKQADVEGKRIRVCDVTLNESKLENIKKSKKTIEYRSKFAKGDIVPVYYSAHGLKGQLVYEVNPHWRALVERSSDKYEVDYDYGTMKMAKVLAINKQSMELNVVLVDNLQQLKPGTTCTARYKSFTTMPYKSQLVLSSGEMGMLSLTAICDDYEQAVKKMRAVKEENVVLEIRLLAHHAEGRTFQWVLVGAERSAKSGGVRDPLVKSADDVKEGETLRGFVAYIKKDDVQIEIGPGILAQLMENSVRKSALRVNDLVALRVLEKDDDGEVIVEVEQIIQSAQAPRKRLSSLSSTTVDGPTSVKRVKVEEGEKEGKRKPRVEKEKKELSDPGFDWSSTAFSMDAMAEIGGIGETEKEDEEMGDVEKEEKPEKKKEERKKRSEMTAAEKEVEKEAKLAEKERRMMDGGAELATEGDYARALKGDPNQAQLWIRYMTHFIGKDELAKARATAEKALSTINYREDAELFSLWCAYINLEVSFGDAESWTAVFTRACDSADSYKIHKHMAATLAENEKYTEADAVFEKLVKKFRAQSDEVWTLYADYLYSNEREEEARALMTRALECTAKTKHVPLITRFATLEYTKGDEEKGRNMFESLLATYPKKIEVWTAYVDLTIKHEDVDRARQVLERVTALPLSVFKLRAFYKRWVKLETEEGDEKSLAEVQKKAFQYLKTLNAELDE